MKLCGEYFIQLQSCAMKPTTSEIKNNARSHNIKVARQNQPEQSRARGNEAATCQPPQILPPHLSRNPISPATDRRRGGDERPSQDRLGGGAAGHRLLPRRRWRRGGGLLRVASVAAAAAAPAPVDDAGGSGDRQDEGQRASTGDRESLPPAPPFRGDAQRRRGG
ncbi:hypothetical protein GUJ93_ZPchr0009g1961 [Zizania palustris]|uniref:Uncharacterized protein n=1 Tax=Zizania palustris TaxID=103762 RepID=A0A8J5R959_ZIZPA|nr:hypothetical protein GUJ93_ZPchr0009g1961 [Zizania palustris]